MKIFIAAGHGASDPGAVANGTNEATELINIVDKAVEILQKTPDPNHEIVKIDDQLNLTDEVAVINRDCKAPDQDIAIEVHLNSNSGIPGSGIESYYGNKELASKLQQTLVSELGLKDRGVKEGNYLYFNNATTPASALLELGFINNKSDLDIVRGKGAEALAAAIQSVIGPAAPAAPQPAPIKQITLQWVVQNYTKIKKFFLNHPEAVAEVEQA